jgi:hypothetical protein
VYLHRKHVLTAVLALTLVGSLVGFARTARAVTPPTPPWEPDANARAAIVFYDVSGNVVTGGSIDNSPVAAYVQATGPGRSVDNTATLFGYVAQPGVNPGAWHGEQMTAGNTYPVTTAPPPLNSSPNPTVAGQPGEESMRTLQTDFPHPPTDAGTPYDGVYQIRIFTSGTSGQDPLYFRADVQITGNTWSQIYPPPPSLGQSTTTTLTASPPSPQTVGTPVNLTATVVPSSATGTVQFLDNAATLGPAVGVTGGVASMSAGSLAVGQHSFSAVFTPTDATAFLRSTANPVPYTINPTSAPPVFTADSPPTTAATGVAYGPYTFAASGIPAPTFSHSGSLPPGLTLNATSGVLSGTPSTAGAFPFTVAATNASASATSPTITITVAAAGSPPAFTADSPPTAARTDSAYSYTFTATGTPAPIFAVNTGTLPPGLALNFSTGVLSGTPTAAGSFTFTVSASNGVGAPVITPSITIVVKGGVAFTAASPPGATVGVPYSYTFAAFGNPPPTFSVSSGSPPTGLTLNASTGVLSGTPTVAGNFTFVVSAADGIGGASTTPSLTIVVSSAGASSGVVLTPFPVDFGISAIGAASTGRVVTLTNHSPAPLTGITTTVTGRNAGDFRLVADACSGTTVAPGSSCTMSLVFVPGAGGFRSGVLQVADSGPGSPQTDALSGRGGTFNGYWLGATDGGIFAFGGAGFFGSAGAVKLNKPVVGLAATPDGRGYWEVASDGGVFTFGSAAFLGSTGSLKLNKPIVGMAATPDGAGYWLVAADGGIFGFGSAAFFGSTGSIHLNKPIVGMAATPDGAGYWLVASDGGMFSFGSAKFVGSAAGLAKINPIVGMAATPDGAGYWLVGSDGGIYAYGTAPFMGSTGSLKLNKPIVAMVASFSFTA